MNKYLQPQIFECEANNINADKQCNHWYKTFNNFMQSIQTAENSPGKLATLISFIAPNVYDYISDCQT